MSIYLDFEAKIREDEIILDELTQRLELEKDPVQLEEINKRRKDLLQKIEEFYANLDAWQRTMIARHPGRPYTSDYIAHMTDFFIELHGDRQYRDDKAIIAGLCKIHGHSFMLIGNEKGRTLNEKKKRNFGMANPEGYRKALRLMRQANRFKKPILTLIDTAGAYPGIEAEERGQGEAIARNLLKMATLQTPIISVIIGEGGSGGALALGVSDVVLMLENSIYSVISPEGCASILFKDSSKANIAACNLKLDAKSLLEFGIIDGIIKEPLGGAHKDHEQVAANLALRVLEEFNKLKDFPSAELVKRRYDKYRNMGSNQLIIE